LRLKDFSKLYFIILLIHLVAIDVGEGDMLINFTKPLLLLSLVAFFWHHTPERNRSDTLFLGGLLFSWLGDILLMFTNVGEIYFTLGLGAFLFAQIQYLLAFANEVRGKPALVKSKPWLAIPLLAYGAYFVYLLYPNLDELRIPVVLYAAVLVSMAIAALNRGGAVHPRSFSLVFIGALFFVASGSVLAYATFNGDFAYSRVVTMATYGVAQYFLVWGKLFEHLDAN
jgi:uncharacterized membrane protein YhhN